MKQLLAKIKREGEAPHVDADNLLELACRDCAKDARRRDPLVLRVLHCFAFDGTFVRSQIVRRP